MGAGQDKQTEKCPREGTRIRDTLNTLNRKP